MEIKKNSNGYIHDAWTSLRSHTGARIALGRTGASIPLEESLAFKLAHANARDAVYSILDVDKLTSALEQFHLPVYKVHSRAFYRQEYLQRPDLGRRLSEVSTNYLKSNVNIEPADVALVLADGLSSTAINRHAMDVLSILVPQLKMAGLSIAPFALVEHGRVAIADEIGEILKARLVVILIGERPGLSAYDSMGAYLTFNPRVGLTDDSRNCVANIRPEGLNYESAAEKILYLITEALRLKLSGVLLKDNHITLPK